MKGTLNYSLDRSGSKKYSWMIVKFCTGSMVSWVKICSLFFHNLSMSYLSFLNNVGWIEEISDLVKLSCVPWFPGTVYPPFCKYINRHVYPGNQGTHGKLNQKWNLLQIKQLFTTSKNKTDIGVIMLEKYKNQFDHFTNVDQLITKSCLNILFLHFQFHDILIDSFASTVKCVLVTDWNVNPSVR